MWDKAFQFSFEILLFGLATGLKRFMTSFNSPLRFYTIRVEAYRLLNGMTFNSPLRFYKGRSRNRWALRRLAFNSPLRFYGIVGELGKAFGSTTFQFSFEILLDAFIGE